MANGNKKFLSRTIISKALIIAGSLCVAGCVGYEAFDYPWGSLDDKHVNEIELQDPPAPDFDYIIFNDAQDSDTDASPEYTDQPAEAATSGMDVLPGEEIKSSSEEEKQDDAALKYVLLGIVKIPRINISENLFEGSGGQMKYGLGHVSGTAMPGEKGNSVIAGHRVSSSGMHAFKYLDKMKNGDIITVKFNGETYTYEVFDVFIVTKYDLWVLRPDKVETHMLTLVTCDPLVYAGNRPNRLIVRARLVTEEGLGTPSSIDLT